ncbi:uncharacterized protein AAES06_001880 isoform 2-T2 [Glossophaga mutica]
MPAIRITAYNISQVSFGLSCQNVLSDLSGPPSPCTLNLLPMHLPTAPSSGLKIDTHVRLQKIHFENLQTKLFKRSEITRTDSLFLPMKTSNGASQTQVDAAGSSLPIIRNFPCLGRKGHLRPSGWGSSWAVQGDRFSKSTR